MIPFPSSSPQKILDEHDRKFMEKLYHDYHRLMFKQARRYSQDQSLIEDIVQQTFVKLIRYLPTIQTLKCNTLAAYIVNVVKSVAMDFYRKQSSEKAINFVDCSDNFEEALDDDFELESFVHDSLEFEHLKQAILDLSETDQFLLKAKYLQQWHDDEIAAVLGIKKGTVRTRLFRARKKALVLWMRGHHEEKTD